jgi:hypothetical protein
MSWNWKLKFPGGGAPGPSPPKPPGPPPPDNATVISHINRLRAMRLVQLSEKDWWTVGNAIEGTQIFGATGSGKTSGSGKTIAKAFLDADFGGLVLTSKPDDVEEWTGMLKACGRSSDLVLVGAGGDHRLDFLEYEFERPGRGAGLTQNVVSLVTNAIGSMAEQGGGENAYWTDSLRQLVTHAVELAVLAQGKASLPDIADIVRDAPQERSDVAKAGWRDGSRCFALLRQADERTIDPERRRDFEATLDYWLAEFPALSDRTRGIIVSMFTSKVMGLLRSPLRQLFCSGTTLRPEASQEGRIIILDLPVKEYAELGRFAQILFTTVWQRSTERRRLTASSRPVFLWADESQYFVTPEDTLYQQTARRSLAATVYLTQNLPNYYAAMGGREGQNAAESFVGNLQTKIFHANGDPTTNEWAERLIGKDWLAKKSKTMTGKGEISLTTAEQNAATVAASVFTTLRKGGLPDRIVEAVVFEGGRTWSSTGENYLRAAFHQGD